MRRKLCRALACPQWINDRTLFCNTHWPMLPPKLQVPIAGNEEVGVAATLDVVRTVLSGVESAVAYIARKEGRSGSLDRAKKSASYLPGQGGVPSSSVPQTPGSTDNLVGRSSGGYTGRYFDIY